MGGWPPGTDLGPCAVNLTDPDDLGRHVTFREGGTGYGIADERTIDGPRAVVWGEIEDGYGGRFRTADGTTIGVLAYGIDEDEAAALFASLAAS